MNRTVVIAVVALGAVVFILLGGPSLLGGDGAASGQRPLNQSWRADLPADAEPERATFAGGCFWCVEAVYEGERGVASAVSGYTGGRAETATYEQVSSGTTDHLEAVRVTYYPSLINYSTLLDMYWRSINPTDAGGQFADRGPQYRTAIFAHSTRQYRLAQASKRALNASGRFERPVVTEIRNASTFFRAEDRHQNYSRRNALRYEMYERASGRKGFLERVWDSSPLS